MLRALLCATCLALALPVAADCLRLAPVQVVDVNTGTIAPDRAVTIADGRIRAIAGADGADSDCTTVDGQGGYLVPALAEMHAHVPGQAQGEDQAQKVLDLFLANGVTTIRGMLGEPWHLALRAELASGERRGPRLITSGPSFNGNSVGSPEQGVARVREQVAAGYDFLKIHPGLERDEFLAIAAAARAAGIPFAGHVSWQTGLEAALKAGQASIDHLDSYAEALLPAGSALAGEPPQWFGLNLAGGFDHARIPLVAQETAVAGVWNVPTQSLFETTAGATPVADLLARPGMDCLSQDLRGNWVQRLEEVREGADPTQRASFLTARRLLIVELEAAGAGLLLGSDAPQIMNVPGYSTHQELAFLVAAGLTPLQALQSGTRNVARFFGEPDRGQVAAGQVADLLLLAGNPLEDIAATTAILGVLQAGRWHDRPALDALRDGACRAGL